MSKPKVRRQTPQGESTDGNNVTTKKTFTDVHSTSKNTREVVNARRPRGNAKWGQGDALRDNENTLGLPLKRLKNGVGVAV